MEAIHNFRDIGGSRTVEGRRVKRGVLYRSASLAYASPADLKELSSLGIRTVCDLRTHEERNDDPDRVPRHAGVRSVHVPIQVNHHNKPGVISRIAWLLFGKARRLDYEAIARESYREYVVDFRAEFASVMKMASEDHNLPLLIHCTAGKDRTGFACSLIQLTLGVSPEVVMADYLRSNNHLDRFKEVTLYKLRFLKLFGVSKQKILPLLEARSEYLEAAWDQISQDYGSVGGYVREGLGFSDEDTRRLKRLFLEEG